MLKRVVVCVTLSPAVFAVGPPPVQIQSTEERQEKVVGSWASCSIIEGAMKSLRTPAQRTIWAVSEELGIWFGGPIISVASERRGMRNRDIRPLI